MEFRRVTFQNAEDVAKDLKVTGYELVSLLDVNLCETPFIYIELDTWEKRIAENAQLRYNQQLREVYSYLGIPIPPTMPKVGDKRAEGLIKLMESRLNWIEKYVYRNPQAFPKDDLKNHPRGIQPELHKWYPVPWDVLDCASGVVDKGWAKRFIHTSEEN